VKRSRCCSNRIPALTPLELRDRALLELAYSQGCVAEELVTVEVGAIDFDAETVRVDGKGGKTRMVPVGEHALAAIARYLERGATGAAHREARHRDLQQEPLFLSRPADGSARLTCVGACAHGRARPRAGRPLSRRRIRTRSDTRSRPTCSRAERICDRFRSCWAMPRFRPLRFTLGWSPCASEPHMLARIHAPSALDHHGLYGNERQSHRAQGSLEALQDLR